MVHIRGSVGPDEPDKGASSDTATLSESLISRASLSGVKMLSVRHLGGWQPAQDQAGGWLPEGRLCADCSQVAFSRRLPWFWEHYAR